MDRARRNRFQRLCPRAVSFLPRTAALLLAVLAAAPARGQLGEAIPGPAYYVAVDAFYMGEYRDAERALRRETQRGVHSVQGRWIDSICYHAMLGEVLYQQGRNAEALAEFDQACQLLSAYPNWLLRLKPEPMRASANVARRQPPWGQSQRQLTPGDAPRMMQIAMGRLDNSQALTQGGVVMQPQYWRINAAEVVRTSALAMRRCAELLGPLAPYDPVCRELADVFGRGNLAPANHWTSAWVDLQRGLAQASLGKFDEADTLLGRAAIADGQFDHPLTCVALLEQGRLAMLRGDSRRAAQLLAEAGFSAYYYENWDALTESVWLGWLNHVTTGGAGVYPPLETVAAWAQTNRLQHTAVKLRLAEAESFLWLGQLPQATALLADTSRRLGDMRTGLAGIHQLYLQANVHLMQGQVGPGGDVLGQALAAQAAASLRNFQIVRAGQMYDSGGLSPRVAVDAYARLLADPTPAEWAYQPLDVMAVIALEPRRRVRPLVPRGPGAQGRAAGVGSGRGGQAPPLPDLVAARRPARGAPHDSRSTGQRTFARRRAATAATADKFSRLSRPGRGGREVVRRAPRQHGPGQGRRRCQTAGQSLRRLGQERRRARAPADAAGTAARGNVARVPAAAKDHRTAKGPRQGRGARGVSRRRGRPLWLSDHRQRCPRLATGRRAAVADHAGRLPPRLGQLQRQSGTVARGFEERSLARRGRQNVRGDLRRRPVGPGENQVARDRAGRCAVVFAVRGVGAGRGCAGEGVGRSCADPLWSDGRAGGRRLREPSAPRSTPASSPINLPQDEDTGGGEEAVQELEQVVAGPVRLPMPLPEPGYLVAALLDELIVLDEVEPARDAGYGWSPLQRSKGAADDTLAKWFALPYGGPERIVLTGFPTAAEQGLKGSRRSSARGGASQPGSEIFQSVCGLMANGARTILLTRWRTGGRTNFDLVREFVQELPHSSATDAWQRACVLAREAPLDTAREPRLKRPDDAAEMPTADHPFFWAGYLLVDSSPRLADDEESDKDEMVADGQPAPAGAAKDAKAKLPLPPPAKPASAPAAQPTASEDNGTPALDASKDTGTGAAKENTADEE